jgi:hypothetical protein
MNIVIQIQTRSGVEIEISERFSSGYVPGFMPTRNPYFYEDEWQTRGNVSYRVTFFCNIRLSDHEVKILLSNMNYAYANPLNGQFTLQSIVDNPIGFLRKSKDKSYEKPYGKSEDKSHEKLYMGTLFPTGSLVVTRITLLKDLNDRAERLQITGDSFKLQ